MPRLLLTLLLCLASCTPKPNTPTPPQPAQPPVPQPLPLPPPDPTRGDPIAWVNTHYIYADDLKKHDIQAWVNTPLITIFVREHNLEPTDEQVERCMKSMEKMFAKDPQSTVNRTP